MTTQLFYPSEGVEFEAIVLRLVNGRYGRQPIAKVNGKEFFLPSHRQLVKLIEEVGLRKPLGITLIKKGNAFKESEYNVRIL